MNIRDKCDIQAFIQLAYLLFSKHINCIGALLPILQPFRMGLLIRFEVLSSILTASTNYIKLQNSLKLGIWI
jgi:hypothetical protein